MGFAQGKFMKIWETTIYEKHTVVSMSSSKKNKQTGNYETDFASNFVRFIGNAHRDAAGLKRGDKIKLDSCEVTVRKSKDGKYLTDFLVYEFTLESTDPNSGTAYGNGNTFMTIPDDVVGELPFS